MSLRKEVVMQKDLETNGQEIEASDEDLIARQRHRWRLQASSAPNLMCRKDEMFEITLELLRRIDRGEVDELDVSVRLEDVESPQTWREYSYALASMGVIQNQKGVLRLTSDGRKLLKDESRSRLASLMADRIRLFAEVLGLLVRKPMTVEEVNEELIEMYNLDWKTVNNTRLRMTWLEVLGLIEWLGDRKQGATREGRACFDTWEIVTPVALVVQDSSQGVAIPEPPEDIAVLLDRLVNVPGAQDARKTYNIWVPSPKSDPNKIQNLKICIAAAAEPIEREDLLSLIASRFGLKRSSVDSMLPFMRASGLLQEVRRGFFAATPAAKAWLRSESDIDFIRILHGNMRFIGELIRAARVGITRNDLYREGEEYGLNTEKVRWLTSFLLEAGLLVEMAYLRIQATSTGLRLIETLPLAEPKLEAVLAPTGDIPELSSQILGEQEEVTQIVDTLIRTSCDPSADGKASGTAFEDSIQRAFRCMGFDAKHIGGPGDTDVLVEWHDRNGTQHAAIVDGKSSSSGRIAHTSVSELAIDTHRDKHSVEFVAIIAKAFGGDTIMKMAQKRKWALITAEQLGEVVVAADALGLQPAEIGLMFEVPDGSSKLSELIDTRQRELDLVSLVISRLKAEKDWGGVLAPHDIWLMERTSQLAPQNDEELVKILSLLDRLGLDIVRIVDKAEDPSYTKYQTGDIRPAIKYLRALASTLEGCI